VSPALALERVTLGYPDRPVLGDISLTVEPGQVFAIVGPNGVGKSTLIKAASGILPLHAGAIWVRGRSITALSASERARQVAVVPQATNVPPAFTARQVVAMGRTAYLGWLEREGVSDREQTAAALERTGTAELAERPMGELSGGERQRVLIARALAQATAVMLLDEPTAHLDLRHQDRVLKLIRDLAHEEGLAVLIALHDLNLVARFADRVALLSSGAVRKQGLPREVLTPTDLAAAYGIEIHVMDHPVYGTPLVLSG
jgi:iron complex transport system ATP-binding protein